MTTAALIVSVLSMIAAIVAAVHAKRSADAASRSAAAEERAAAAAEHALELEHERAAAERRARDEQRAPRIDAGAISGNVWVFENRPGRLSGVLHNHGPSMALLERVELLLRDGLEPVPAVVDENESRHLGSNEAAPVEFDWPYGRLETYMAITLGVTFRATDFDYRASALFTLRPGGTDHIGAPMWVPRETEITRL